MLWKTLFGRCIYCNEQRIRIYDNGFFRWLKFESDAIQTLINKHSPSKPGLHYILPLIMMAQQAPGHCCLLGLGGAGAAHALAPSMQDFTITAIEVRAEVIQLASSYFMTNQLSNLEIIHQDALSYIQTSQATFKHILVDLFHANDFPKDCHHPLFFAECYRLLDEEGILAVNLANAHEQKPIFELISRAFLGNTVVIPVKSCANLVILASKMPGKNNLLSILKASKKLKSLNWDPQWGSVAEIKS